MKNNINDISIFLKTIINKNGINYLQDRPYEVYKEMIKSDLIDKNIAASFLHLFVCIPADYFSILHDVEFNSQKIQKECFFSKEISDYLAQVITTLYSKENKTEWKNNELMGLKEFLSEDFKFSWECNTIWDEGNVYCDCHYEASIILKPTNKIKEDKVLAAELNRNSFQPKEFIYNYFANELEEYLNKDFEEYCCGDDYYPPVCEDYGDNLESCLRKWCDKNGFEYISCDGDGETSNYQSNY